MNTNKPFQNIRLGWSPFVVIAVTTLAAIAISIYCLLSSRVIIFQNLFSARKKRSTVSNQIINILK